ncbi:MFS transporter [uncultured Nonlabens sp.]|jgi:fucose permease|uniref:MFS transporter n=1 Tax=uncultured Nonlabens sp. TaxID=859306 RepID=UPI0030D6D0F5|tara:strand:- start:4613 stop:5782 length:1170 start_codon:yes stop_codon:yes gene_type:complete
MKSLQLILSNLKYFAPSWVFSSVNILIGTWILYLPHIKMKFELNDSQIGLALFFTACGLLISIPFVPYINNKIGVGRSTQVGILFLALFFNLPLLASNYYLLCSSLLFTGIFSGFTGTSMNALVSIIEKRDQQNFMSAAHGFFSLGGFIGAGIGSFLILQFSNPSYHMLLMSSVIILSTLVLSPSYKNIIEAEEDKSGANTNIFKNIQPVLGLSIIAFIIMFNEGAVEHWSNLFLFDIVRVSESQAGFGFVIFSLTMTLGRFLGDGVSKKIGSIKSISFGLIIAAVAYSLILVSNFYTTVLGFGVLGLGISVIVPEVFRLAGKTKGLNTSVAISVVSGIGFMGFLVGPVLLGLISNWSNLIMSYVFLLALIVTAFGLVVFRLSRKYRSS